MEAATPNYVSSAKLSQDLTSIPGAAKFDLDHAGVPGEQEPNSFAKNLRQDISSITLFSDERDEHPVRETGGRDSSSISGADEWALFGHWAHCVCIVTFDLELGQALEFIYPTEARLTDKEKTNICYLSFPDSNSGLLGDIQFHFRLRKSVGPLRLSPAKLLYNQKAPPPLHADPGYLFGYVYFRQVKDKSLPRGYLQKSVVLLSHLPLISFYSHIVRLIAPGYFDSGEASIEAACHNINQWPRPDPGTVLSLPLLGSVVQIRLPSRFDNLPLPSTSPHIEEKIRPPSNSFPDPIVLTSVHEVNLYDAFAGVIPHVQLLWELVLTGEPLVIMAPSPTLCSDFVHALVSLIWPLRYAQDYRPFFTIHDSEFKEFTLQSEGPPGVILGVTNPFFAKTFQHWQHVVRLGTAAGGPITESASSSPVASAQKVKKAGDLRTLDGKAGLFTKYTPFLGKDKTFLKRLFKGIQSKRPSEVQSALIKRHFLEITQSFMIPLERYIASLMPLQRNISPLKGSPRVREFDPEEFLATIDISGPQLTSGIRGDWVGLYRKFFNSPNFGIWLKLRQSEVNQKLELLHLEVLCKADLLSAVRDRSEIEIVDLVLKLREKQEFILNNRTKIRPDVQYKLQAQYASLMNLLSKDLRAMFGRYTADNR